MNKMFSDEIRVGSNIKMHKRLDLSQKLIHEMSEAARNGDLDKAEKIAKQIERESKTSYFHIDVDYCIFPHAHINPVLNQDPVSGYDYIAITPVIEGQMTVDTALIQMAMLAGDLGYWQSTDDIRSKILDDSEARDMIQDLDEKGREKGLHKWYYSVDNDVRVCIDYYPADKKEDGRREAPWLWATYYYPHIEIRQVVAAGC